jgi:uncharacterized delta-60 repeat protein
MLARYRLDTGLLILAVMAVTVSAFASACGRPPATADGGESGTDTSSEDTSCIPAEPACECNDGLCLPGLECIDNICVSLECDLGELGCECNEGACLPGLECVAGMCMEPGGDGDGDGDGDGEPGDGDGEPGDGDGEPGDGDGDGDPCGNGDIELGEDCDDGNNENGDGCNNDCTDSGAMLWQETFPVLNEDDYAWGVAVDSSDRIFVCGETNVVNVNNVDGWYRKYSPDGQLFWDETFGTANYEAAYGIAVAPDDDILVTGSLFNVNAVSSDAMLRKLDQNGAEIWTRLIDINDDHGFGVAVAGDGTIVVTGASANYTGFLRRYDADGVEIWTQNFGGYGWEAGYTADGNIAVVFNPNRYVRLYTTAGSEVWTFEQNGTCDANSLAIDGNDVLLAGCEIANPYNAWFGRIDPDGTLLWDETWAGDGNTFAIATDIEVDSAGRIVAVGSRVTIEGRVAVARKYSSDGQTLLWEQTVQGGKMFGSNEATGVTIDSQDNVIVVGYVEEDADYDAFVAKYGP